MHETIKKKTDLDQKKLSEEIINIENNITEQNLVTNYSQEKL